MVLYCTQEFLNVLYDNLRGAVDVPEQPCLWQASFKIASVMSLNNGAGFFFSECSRKRLRRSRTEHKI